MNYPSFTVILHWVQIVISFYNLYLQNALPFASNITIPCAGQSPRPFDIHVSSSSNIETPADRAVIHIKLSAKGLKQDRVSKDLKATHDEVMNFLRPLTEIQSMTDGNQTNITSLPPIVDLSVDAFKADSRRRTSTMFGEKPLYEASTDIEAEFADVNALGRIIARLSRTPRVDFDWLKWKLSDEARKDVISRCKQEAGNKLMQTVQDYTKPMGFERARPKDIREHIQTGNDQVLLSRMQDQFWAHAELAFDAMDETDKGRNDVQFVYDFEPKTLQIQTELCGDFEVW